MSMTSTKLSHDKMLHCIIPFVPKAFRIISFLFLINKQVYIQQKSINIKYMEARNKNKLINIREKSHNDSLYNPLILN